jgi:antitoxin component of MazEF toxin-antitoxin module
MPHVFRVDATKPDALYQALKEVDVSEGTEFEVEKVSDGSIHLTPTGYRHFEEQKRRLLQLANFEIPEDDSEQWNRAIKAARTTSTVTPID